LNFSLRTLVHSRVSAAFGKPFDYFLMEEPWRVYEVLKKALGKHNAELFINILTDWLRRNGCEVTRDQVLRYLTAREAWG
jgi:ATP-dependent phosphoenolpyruvate carboxykinase